MITNEFIQHEAQQEAAEFMSKMMAGDYIEKLQGKKEEKNVWGYTQAQLDEIKQYPCLSAYEDAKHKEWKAKQKAKKKLNPKHL